MPMAGSSFLNKVPLADRNFAANERPTAFVIRKKESILHLGGVCIAPNNRYPASGILSDPLFMVNVPPSKPEQSAPQPYRGPSCAP